VNFGGCPYEGCDGFFATALPERTPIYDKQTCKLCGRVVWLKLSRWDPEAYTEESFVARYQVDEATKKIRDRTVRDQPRAADSGTGDAGSVPSAGDVSMPDTQRGAGGEVASGGTDRGGVCGANAQVENFILEELSRHVIKQMMHDVIYGAERVCFWGCEYCPPGRFALRSLDPNGQAKVDRIRKLLEGDNEPQPKQQKG